jgi:hypothetical protein
MINNCVALIIISRASKIKNHHIFACFWRIYQSIEMEANPLNETWQKDKA